MSALTKILIVLQLVFSLVCAVLLVLMVSRSENYKGEVVALKSQSVGLGAQVTVLQKQSASANGDATSARDEANAARKELAVAQAKFAQDVSDAKKNQLSAEGQNAILTSQVATLQASNSIAVSSLAAKDEELKVLRPRVEDLTKKNAEISQALSEASNQLRDATMSIRKLQEIIAQGPTTLQRSSVLDVINQKFKGMVGESPLANGSAGDTGAQVQELVSAPASNKINAPVSEVAQSSGRVLIEMPLGLRDGIQVGTKMYVYRASGYVADVTVQNVTQDQAVAVVMSTKPGETVQKGDLVSTTGK